MQTETINRLSPNYQFDSSTAKIDEAEEFFAQTGSSAGLADAKLNPNLQDSDGLVSYIVATSNPVPDRIKDLYATISPVMEGLTNVVVSAVIKQAGTNAAKLHAPDTWRAPMQAMIKAFCAGYSETARSYDQQVRGVEIASKFINVLIEAVANQGAALADFTKFLRSQGETINAQLTTGSSGYLYAAVSVVHEIFETADNTFIYVPKFKSYFTRFSEETLKLTTSCGSVENVRFKFDLDIMTGAFLVESWKSFPAFRDRVNQFIQRFQQANIADSENFFDGVFESQQA